MTTLTFLYISQVSDPWLTERVQRPVLVFADGHKSHLTPETANFCASNGILLIALYSNSTHLLQPLDVSVFKLLKSLREKAKNKRKAAYPNKSITKKNFPLYSRLQ